MNSFNYSNLHFFDKSGTEIMLKYTSSIKIDVVNSDFPSGGSSYIFIPGENGSVSNSSFLRTKDGSRFKQKESYTVITTLPDGTSFETSVQSSHFDFTEYSSSKGYTNIDGTVFGEKEYSIYLKYNESTDSEKRNFLDLIGIPVDAINFESAPFEANLVFDKVSTELVETQSIFILSETTSQYNNVFGIHGLVDVSTNAVENESAMEFMNKYNMMFFIDCRNQSDFRFFTIDGDSVVWSDRHFVDFSNGRISISENGFRVDIGFRGELEGVYDQKMYVCLVEKQTNDIHVIGTFNMTAETEGEDERYRAFFANFGLPGMDEIEPAFRESDINEDYPDYVMRNRHAKKMFLSYSEIFPYAGSYKALANAVKFLGYDDIFFKEWYKDLGTTSPMDEGYVAYDISFKSNNKLNTINSKPIEERIHLRKMNWISMMYKLNEEVDGNVDRWGFPMTKENINYYNAGNLVKLISLKNWLDKYIIGVNCRIMNVGGEGIVFERYIPHSFGQYQQVFDYTNEKELSIKINRETETIIDGSANISININTSNEYDTFENFEGKKIIDFACACFDGSTYNDNGSSFPYLGDGENLTYFGMTFEMQNNMDSFDIRTKGLFNSFKFNNDEFIFSEHPQVIIDNDRIFFDPRDITKKPRNSAFKTLPVIKIERGTLKRYDFDEYNTGLLLDKIEIEPNESGTKITHRNYASNTTNLYSTDGDFTIIPPKSSVSSSQITFSPKFYRDGESYSYNTRRIGGPFVVHVVGGSGRSNIPFDDKTIGFRFTADTFDGTPSFMVAGYVSPQIYAKYGIHLPLQNEIDGSPVSEYYMEILSGSIMFSDEANNRMVSVNFRYDGNTRKIDITTFQTSERFTIYEYLTSDDTSVSRFKNGSNYQYFVSKYRDDVDSAIISMKTKSINVMNAGTYEIDSIISDEYNNLFCAKANRTVNVVVPEIDTSTFTCDSSFVSTSTKEGTRIDQSDAEKINGITSYEGNKCIYEYVPKKNIMKRESSEFTIGGYNTKGGKIDNGTEEYRNESSFKYTQLSNLTEKFSLVATYTYSGKKVLSFIKRSYIDNSTGFVTQNTYDDVLNMAHLQPNVNIVDPSTNQNIEVNPLLLKYYNASRTSINDQIGTLSNANVILYDTSCEYPLYSYPGVCVAVKGYLNDSSNYNFYEYRFMFDESVTNGEISDFITAAQDNSIDIYMIPAWALECYLSSDGQNIVKTKGYSNLAYPFKKPLVVNDDYKISFIDIMDIATSPYNDSSTWRQALTAEYGNNSPSKFTNSFGHSTCHLTKMQHPTGGSAASESQSSYWGNEIELDTSINSGYSKNTNIVKMYVSHAAKEYSEFIVRNDEEKSNYRKGEMSIENNSVNRELSYYFDTTYSASFRNFDVRNGIVYWNDENESIIGEMYSYICPVVTESGKLMIVPILDKEFTQYENGFDVISNVDYTTHWKVFKQKNNSTHDLIFECFNKVLTMDIPEKGTYDIEMTIYDKHGNKFERSIIGAATIK